MKLIRTEWPRVRQFTYKGNTYFQVDLRKAGYTGPSRKGFSEREKALAFARGVAAKVTKGGMDSITAFSSDPQMVRWATQAAMAGKTLEEVFTMGLNLCNEQE